MPEDASTPQTGSPGQPKPSDVSGYDQPVSLVLLTLVIFLFSQIVIGILLGILMFALGQGTELFERITESNIQNFLLIALMVVLQFVAIYFVVRRLMRRSLKSIGLVKPVGADIARAALGWGIYMFAVIVAMVFLNILDTGIDLEQEQQIDFQPTPDLLERGVVFLSLVAAPAFIEEVLMRGFLFLNLRRRLNFLQSTLIVSVLFGLAHLQFGTGEPLLWVAFVDTFVLSLILCGLTEKYKTLWPAIFAHAMKNSIAFYLLFVREG
jgi:uncharacterized protein